MKAKHIVILLLCLFSLGAAYGQNTSTVDTDDVDSKSNADQSSPTFVPMVKASKGLVDGDSIHYEELNVSLIDN